MEFPKVVFEIVRDNECPYYAEKDRFALSGKALVLTDKNHPRFITTAIIEIPPGKPECPVLYGDLTNVLIKYNGVDKISAYSLTCSGCSGTVHLEYAKEQRPAALKAAHASHDDVARRLQNFSIFRTLDIHNIRDILGHLSKAKFETGARIINIGDVNKKLYIILAGKVEIVDDGGNAIASLGVGEVFGEMSLLSGDPASAAVVAAEPLKTLCIKGRQFRQIVRKYPSLQMVFTQMLSRRLRRTNLERARESRSGMIGKLTELAPADLYQVLKSNRKTGILTLTLRQGPAKLYFSEGELVRAQYEGKTDQDAFFATLRETDGRFRFVPGLPREDEKRPPIASIMWLLMEGLRLVDEENGLFD